jgi:HPr kinase/phosphorylase
MTDKINVAMEETSGYVVDTAEFASACGLDILFAEDNSKITLCSVSVNRPGLALADFYDYFASTRLQVFGYAEMRYLEKMPESECQRVLKKLMQTKIPCVILSRGLQPTKNMIRIARENGIPVLLSQKTTSELVNDLVAYLNEVLAPRKDIHGVLLDIDGVGVLLTGNSGIGKSETALELVHRGHMLVADDLVDIRCVKNKLIGSASAAIRDFMEVRGVGIINVRSMYGVAGVLPEKQIDVIIELQKWDSNTEYDRLGNDKHCDEIFGVKVPKLVIPVMAGRNLAIVVEVAAKNVRLKALGCDAMEELEQRLKYK